MQFHQESSGDAPPVEEVHSKQHKVLPRVNHRYILRDRFVRSEPQRFVDPS